MPSKRWPRTPNDAALDPAAFEAALDALAEGSENLPVLPAEATSRTEIYRDRN